MSESYPNIHYPKAPIIEAVIDLRAELPSEVSIEDLKKAYDTTDDNYKIREEINTNVGTMHFGNEIRASASSKHIGFKFINEESNYTYQVRLDGFTISHLAPYKNWVEFSNEARCKWEFYNSALKPLKIDRLAVRYINRIDIPLPTVDFKDYLRTSPEVSPDLPQGLANFFMELDIPFEDINGMAKIKQTIAKPFIPEGVSIVLDIDVFKKIDSPENDIDIWEQFESLRHYKNKIFEACITNKSRELFK